MNTDFMLIPTGIMNKLAVTEILNCNEVTIRFGLALSAAEAVELAETRTEALRNNGRIEFAGGIIQKMIIKFCDSPYLSQFNYAAQLHDLLETFYYFKNETLDEITDDELMSLMKNFFDHSCQGSIELLQHRELETVARNIRFRIRDHANFGEDTNDEEENDE